MKKIICLFAATVVVATLAATAQAQSIAWGGAQGMVGDTDVANIGTYFDAITFSPATTAPVNGVLFNAATNSGPNGNVTSSDASGDISVVSSGDGSPNAYGSAFTTSAPSSVNYSDITKSIAFGYFANNTVTLANLTPSDTYQVQVWSWYPGSATSGLTTLTGSTPVTLDPSVGQYSIGTFTATGATETFNYDYVNQYGIINAVSVLQTVPEPSIWAMMLGGFGMLLAGQRIRRSSKS